MTCYDDIFIYSPSFELINVINDISQNISNLTNNLVCADLSNQIYDLSVNINVLNTKVLKVLEIYNILDNIESRLS